MLPLLSQSYPRGYDLAAAGKSLHMVSKGSHLSANLIVPGLMTAREMPIYLKENAELEGLEGVGGVARGVNFSPLKPATWSHVAVKGRSSSFLEDRKNRMLAVKKRDSRQ